MHPETDRASQGDEPAVEAEREDLVRALNTLGFPATTDQVRAHARERNVRIETLEMLDGLPSQRFDSLPDLVHEVYGERQAGQRRGERDSFGRTLP